MNTSDQLNSVNTTATSTTTCPVPQACGSRLPCGLCLITNQRCPMLPCQPNIVWTSTNGNTTGQEPHLPTVITCTSAPEAKY